MGRRAGFGSIERLASGRFRARYPAPDGRRYAAPVTFATKGEARAWLSLQHAEITRKAWAPPQTVPSAVISFGSYAEQWLARRDSLRPGTREHYRKLLDRHLIPAFGPDALSAISPESVVSWHAGMGTRTPTLRSHCYRLLRTILGTALTDRLIAANPVHIRGAGSVKRAIAIRPLTLPELEKLTQAMPEQYQAMILLASWCALRLGELTELRRRDIDIDMDAGRGVVHVERAVVRVDGSFVVGPPKSTAGRRDVAIPPRFLGAIQEHLARHVGPDDDALLFGSRHGTHLAASTLDRHFYPARALVGRPDLRFHDLRHTGAELAASSGATLAELMGRLGHSTPAVALRYQHVAQDADQILAERMSRLADGL